MSRYRVTVWTASGRFRGHGRFFTTSEAMAAANVRFGDSVLGIAVRRVAA